MPKMDSILKNVKFLSIFKKFREVVHFFNFLKIRYFLGLIVTQFLSVACKTIFKANKLVFLGFGFHVVKVEVAVQLPV